MDSMPSYEPETCSTCHIVTLVPELQESRIQKERRAGLLSCNDQPLDTELPHLRVDLAAVKEDVQAIDKQIKHLQRHIDELRAHKSHRESLSRKLESTIGVVRRVPEDVWGQIFYEAVDPGRVERFHRHTSVDAWYDHEGDPCDGVFSDLTAWYTASVCKSWRSMVIGQGSLWATIIANCSDWMASHHIEFLRLQLERAGPRKLTIYINPKDNAEGGWPLLLPLIRGSFAQWEKLFLPFDMITDDFLAYCSSEPLPNLTTVSFHGMSREPLSSTQRLCPLKAPLLTEFIGSGVSSRVLGRTVTTWSHPACCQDPDFLTPYDHFLDTLHRLPLLEKCEIFGYSGTLDRGNPITHANLRSLTFIDYSSADEGPPEPTLTLFHGISLPALRSFHYTATLPTMGYLDSFITRCGGGLTTLSLEVTIRYPDSNPQFKATFERIYRVATQLRCLMIDVGNIQGCPHLLPLIQTTPNGASPALMPLLEVLWVRKSIPDYPDLKGIWDFHQRVKQVRPNLRIVTGEIGLGLPKEWNTKLADRTFAMEYLTAPGQV